MSHSPRPSNHRQSVLRSLQTSLAEKSKIHQEFYTVHTLQFPCLNILKDACEFLRPCLVPHSLLTRYNFKEIIPSQTLSKG